MAREGMTDLEMMELFRPDRVGQDRVAAAVRIRLRRVFVRDEDVTLAIQEREAMKRSLIEAGDEKLWYALDDYRRFTVKELVPMFRVLVTKQVADRVANKLAGV